MNLDMMVQQYMVELSERALRRGSIMPIVKKEKSMEYENGDLYKIHETRIQRLEEDRVEATAGLVEQTTTLRSIKEDVVEMKGSLISTNKHIETLISSFVEHVKNDEIRLNGLEKQEKAKEKSKDWQRKVIYGLIMGAGSLFGVFAERMLGH
jgi:hypothetical protein